MDKIKILIVADVLGEANNGTTMTIQRLIAGLKKRNYDVYVVSPQKGNEEDGYYTLKKRNFYCFNKYVEKNGVVLAVPNEKLLRELIAKVDLVHIELPFKVGRMALRICRETNKPFTTAFHCPAEAVTAHLGMKNFKLANDYIYKRHFKNFYQYCSIVHCPSQYYANILKNKGYNNNLKVISNGVANMFQPKTVEKTPELQGKFCILFVGRLSLEKRQDILVNAVKMSKYNDKIQVVLAGDGPTKEKIIKLSKGLSNEIIIKFLKGEDLVNMMNMCDLYVHCSDIEVEGISCLEAISAGMVPIISNSPKSATRDFSLTPDNSFEQGSPESLRDKIEYLFENPQRIEQLRKIYKEFGKNFAIDECINKMCGMFEEALYPKKA